MNKESALLENLGPLLGFPALVIVDGTLDIRLDQICLWERGPKNENK